MDQLCILASCTVHLPAKEIVQDADSRATNRTNVLDGVERDSAALVELVLSTSEQGLELVTALLVTRAGTLDGLAYK